MRDYRPDVPPKPKMQVFRTTILAAVLLTAHCAARDEGSLFDGKKARKPSAEDQSLLGPKSGSLRYDPRMIRAVQIAKQRAKPRMTWHCWKYVKDALLAANVVNDRPKSAWAKQAGDELCRQYGFKKLNVRNPYAAPVGAVIVYGGPDAGHVELRTADGFVSDFISRTAYPRPLVGVFVKPSWRAAR